MAYKAGQLVCLKADSSRQGPVIAVLPSVAGRPRYRVFHSPTEIREYYEEQLATADWGLGQPTAPATLALDSSLSAEEFCA